MRLEDTNRPVLDNRCMFLVETWYLTVPTVMSLSLPLIRDRRSNVFPCSSRRMVSRFREILPFMAKS